MMFIWQDFLEVVVHHVATIILMVFSWSNNMVRVGTLVLVVHDAVDYWMEVCVCVDVGVGACVCVCVRTTTPCAKGGGCLYS